MTPRVVIIGGGFGGLTAAQSLRGAKVEVALIDRTNHHLFQPLLYQVAMAGLTPAEIAMPIRSVLRRQKNAKVLLGEVQRVDLAAREVITEKLRLPYDYLVVATGARTSYFGHDDWARYAVGLKDLDDAIEIRRRVLLAFEAAEKETDPARREALMTFVVVGGGPTGVELAGALAELSRVVLARDFRAINPWDARVLLIEGGPRLLAGFAPRLSDYAAEELRRKRVDVRLSTRVQAIDERGVHIGERADQTALIATHTAVWAAGVAANPLGALLGAPTDRAGRVLVEKDLTLPGHREVFVIGDAAAFLHEEGGRPLPGVSPVAMQQARYVARLIREECQGERSAKQGEGARERFRYFDKGSMATIGRNSAIAERGPLKMTGMLAWLAWLLVHIFYLIGFRNRIVTLIDWAWYYFTYRRGARLITGHRMEPGAPAS